MVRLGVLDEGVDARMSELQARLKATRSALTRLDGICDDENIPEQSRQRLRDLYEERIRRYQAGLDAGQVTEEYAERSAAWSHWRRELFAAEREAVLSMRDAGEINVGVMRRIERDLDLEELRL